MSEPLHVIALVSGGKDSFFSLLHCLANNHHIIALANLYPPPLPSTTSNNETDLNSYMYQTVGHTLIPLYSTLLNLPLYRQQIDGSAVDVEKDYATPHESTFASADEVESLVPLLQRVKAAHPTANAVSTGAILSSYQRTRVESVALRLGLVPLSYLWEYPSLPAPIPSPGGLLRDMAMVNLDARIVKVASGGLDDGLLWENVCEERVARRLERAMRRFGGSVLGEGGEYETLVVGGPMGVWKGRVDVGEGERRVMTGEGGEAWLNFRGGKRAEFGDDEKVGKEEMGEISWQNRLRRPRLWDERFDNLVRELSMDLRQTNSGWVRSAGGERQDPWQVELTYVQSKSILTINNISCVPLGHNVEDQMAWITTHVARLLAENNRLPDDIIFTTILLRRMADFSTVNTAYGKLFGMPNPPARATVGCGDTLPQDVDIMLSLVVDVGPRSSRTGLHVQSRSYWAPANIGPYSQAISTSFKRDNRASLVFIAGQIPLVPVSMDVLGRNGEEDSETYLQIQQAVLSLQHLWRIGLKMDVSWWTGAVAYVVGEKDAFEKALIAASSWKAIHVRPTSGREGEEKDADNLDLWDKKYCGSGNIADAAKVQQLPDFEKLLSGDTAPGFFAIQVDELPRGCSIEWQGLGSANSKVSMKRISNDDGTVETDCDMVDMAVTYLEVPISITNDHLQTVLDRLEKFRSGTQEIFQVTVYSFDPAVFSKLNAQIVPCRKIWGLEGNELKAGIVIYAGTASS